jgi:predicted glycosyltransferase
MRYLVVWKPSLRRAQISRIDEKMPPNRKLADFPATSLENTPKNKPTSKKIWVDLDNSPHVPFFRPIIEELRKRNYEVLVTARDAYQVRELIEFYGVPARVVGKHYGKHKILKALGTCWRALALIRVVRKEKPDLAICHGSRGMLIASKLLKIPSVAIIDYEFTARIPFVHPTWVMIPSVFLVDHLAPGRRIIKYPGIKEDVYLSRFRPDQTLRRRLGILPDHLLITVRPPASEAHYHNPEAEKLLTEALNRSVGDPSSRILLLPRNKRQEGELRSAWAENIASGKIVIPDHVEDGLNLIWNSDLVISGGGTMNREAAALGVPVYSIFRGKIGGVDHYLADEGRLVMLETVEDVRAKIKAVRRKHSMQHFNGANSPALETIVRNIVSIVEYNTGSPQASN